MPSFSTSPTEHHFIHHILRCVEHLPFLHVWPLERTYPLRGIITCSQLSTTSFQKVELLRSAWFLTSYFVSHFIWDWLSAPFLLFCVISFALPVPCFSSYFSVLIKNNLTVARYFGKNACGNHNLILLNGLWLIFP